MVYTEDPDLVNITVETIKNRFRLDLIKLFGYDPFNPYSLWLVANTYNIDEEVYSDTNYKVYKSLINSNTDPLTNISSWEVQANIDLVNDYILDAQIQQEMNIAELSVDLQCMSSNQKQEAFMLLVMFRIILTTQSRNIEMNQVASKSADGLAVSYNIAQFSQNPDYAIYFNNKFGVLYFMMLRKRAGIGMLGAIQGTTFLS